MIHKSTSLTYEPSSELFHISAKQLFSHQTLPQVNHPDVLFEVVETFRRQQEPSFFFVYITLEL